jgi:capsule polysaccharide modification protein KpsS
MKLPNTDLLAKVRERVRVNTDILQGNWRLARVTRQVTQNMKLSPDTPPVAFFNASTRLSGISLNAAFAYLAAAGLQLAGIPVVYFGCQSGMSRCVLGTRREDPSVGPPCRSCTGQAGWLFAHAPTVWFNYRRDERLASALEGLSLSQLVELEYCGRPLGRLALPGLRWILRRHHIEQDEAAGPLLWEYILSAHNVAEEFSALLERVDPQAVVVFNGIMYPEATARWVANQRGVRVITHEVGLQPYSAFFTDGDATAYPLDIPVDFELSSEQNARLDAYLEQRFQGKFSMAGIRFWPEMNQLDPAFQERIKAFRQVVPVFTNVIFDTSQIHANTVFPHMFSWLDQVAALARQHADTLFVIRAHPDEFRPGKESRESVEEWYQQSRLRDLENVILIGSRQYLSSYELIRQSKFVMVYNSSIGLEASLMGAPVLCAGRARYTQIPTVFFPETPEAFHRQAVEFLQASSLEAPAEFRRNARRFLYYQLFRASLPFGDYLEEGGPWPGFVRMKPFSWRRLAPGGSPTIDTLVEGILHGKPFLLPDSYT